MSAAVFHFPEYKLTKLLRKPGGKTVANAVAEAQKGLGLLAGDCLAEVDKIIGELDPACAALGASPTREQLLALYEIAVRLVGLSSVAGLVELDRVAYSLCDLVDRMIVSERAALEPIMVHVGAINLLRQRREQLSEEALGQIAAGLRKVRDKYAGGDTPPAKDIGT